MFGGRPFLADQVRVPDQLLNPGGPGESVSQSGGVPHQVLDRDRPLGGDELERLAVFDPDLHLREGGNVFRHGLVDREPPFLDQRHRRDADDRLGHGIDAEDRVLGHRRSAWSEGAEPLGEADLAVPRDQHGDAGSAARGDLALHCRGQPIQRRAVEADLLGTSRRQASEGGGKRIWHRGPPFVQRQSRANARRPQGRGIWTCGRAGDKCAS